MNPNGAKKQFTSEIKAYAKSLYMLFDDLGKDVYTAEQIVELIKTKFGKAPSLSTYRCKWIPVWSREKKEARVLANTTGGAILNGGTLSPDFSIDTKHLHEALSSYVKYAVIATSARTKQYAFIEQLILDAIAKVPKDADKEPLDDEDAQKERERAYYAGLDLKSIQGGLKLCDDVFTRQAQMLMKLFEGAKNSEGDLIEIKGDPVWEFDPVDIVTFIESPDFLDLKGKIYDCVMKDLKELFYGNPRNLDRVYKEGLFKEAFGTGKSEKASICSAYMAYLMLCLRDPASYFGLLPGSKLTIINVSVNGTQAKHVVFGKIKEKVERCKWFRENGYEYDKRSKLQLRFDSSEGTHIEEGKIYKNVYIIPGSSSVYSAYGYDIICAIIDEATLYPKVDDIDTAETIYCALKDRIKSRFGDRGLLLMAGNPMHRDDFLERRVREAKGDPRVYVVNERSTWEAKTPDWSGDVFYFNRKKLCVVEESEKNQPDVYMIPVLYKDNFERKPETSARDIAGWSTASISRYITQTKKVDEIFKDRKNPVKSVTGTDVEFEDWFKPISSGWHVIHIDLGVTGDACGISIGHIYDYKDNNPSFWIDAVIRIEGTKTNPVIFEKIRQLIYKIQDLKFQIKVITMDGFQSTDMIQILRSRGFKAELLSVDKDLKQYGNFRNAINESRLSSPHNEVLKTEILTLENVNNKKVDHPYRGSKDLADAEAGAVNGMIEYIPKNSITTHAEENSTGDVEVEPAKKVRSADEIFEDNLLT